jgi:hypothetical protein
VGSEQQNSHEAGAAVAESITKQPRGKKARSWLKPDQKYTVTCSSPTGVLENYSLALAQYTSFHPYLHGTVQDKQQRGAF